MAKELTGNEKPGRRDSKTGKELVFMLKGLFYATVYPKSSTDAVLGRLGKRDWYVYLQILNQITGGDHDQLGL